MPLTTGRTVSSHSLSTILSRLRVAFGTFVAIEAEASGRIHRRARDRRGVRCPCNRRKADAPDAMPGAISPASGSARPATRVRLDPWTCELLELCARLHRSSGGHFDPCLPCAAGRLPDLDLTEPRSPACGRRCASISAASPRALPSIAPSMPCGPRAATADSSMQAEIWPHSARALIASSVAPRAVMPSWSCATLRSATSEVSARNSRPPEHRGHYHGVDGTPAASGAVTVIAASAAVADGLTKCLLLGTRRGARAAAAAIRCPHEVLYQNANPSPRSKRVKSVFSSNH